MTRTLIFDAIRTPRGKGKADGTALMLIDSEAKGRELGLPPRARIVATAVTSTDPALPPSTTAAEQ
jgi:acetyl-CoA C-acetyltransferase